MLKLTKTGIGLLTRQYRSVLHKCFLINIGAWITGAFQNIANTISSVGGAVGEFANNFIAAIKLPAKPFASLYEGTLNTFNVIDGLKHNIPKGISKVALLATVATVVMLPSEAEAYTDEEIDQKIYEATTIPGWGSGGYIDEYQSIISAITSVDAGLDVFEQRVYKYYATKDYVDGLNVSHFTNDAGYLTSSDLDAEERYIFDTINSWDLASKSYVDSAINNISGYVPTSRTINGKALTGNITLTAADVGALPSTTALFSGNYNDLTNKPTIPTNTNQLTNGAGFIISSVSNLTNYYTKNESDESSKRANLTTQNGDTLNKESNTFSAMAENVPATKLRYNNKPTITGTNSTEFSLRGILDRKRFKMFADLLQQATNDNALTITTNVTTIAA